MVSSVVPRPAASAGAAPHPPAGEPAAPARPPPAAPPRRRRHRADPQPDGRHFLCRPDPDSPAYVKVGDHVGPETTVCIVEAMKVFNQIPGRGCGQIVAVLGENGEPVEFGQPLFKVDTRQ